MAMNPLPPQAYTRETLQKAYQWLLTQSPSIKEMASNQDILVSLYLKAQRNGDAILEAPSIQNFKQELKSLATMMGDFQNTQATQNTAPHQPVTTSSGAISTLNLDLDTHSFQTIQEVRKTLNLSSDTEALRALISLGLKQFKKLNS